MGGSSEVVGEFDGVPGLGERLAGAEQTTTCFAEQMYRFGLGLESPQVLGCAIDPVAESFVESGGDIPTLVLDLVTSNAFRMRVLAEQE